MREIVWQTEHSVETVASPDFAWAYMAYVANWDDPPAQFRLDGPFVTGGRGTTELPGQPPRSWQLRNVQPIESYTLEFSLDGAVLAFTWRFTGLGDGRTCLTQQITLEGENAAAYIVEIQQAFASNLAPGMKRVAASLDRAYIAHQP